MRDVEIPSSIFIYIIMSRAQIVGDMLQTRPSIEIWKERVKQLRENKRLGHHLSWLISSRVKAEVGKIKEENQRVKAEVGKIKEENQRVKEENTRLSAIREWLRENGYSPEEVVSGFGTVKGHKIDEIINGLPFHLTDFLDTAQKNLVLALQALEKKRDGR